MLFKKPSLVDALPVCLSLIVCLSLVSVANRTLHFVFEVEQILVHFFFCGQGQWKAHATSVGGAVEVSPFARFSITRKVLPRAHAHMYTRTP